MTVHMPPSIGSLILRVSEARNELSSDLMAWGTYVSLSIGPKKLWDGYTGPIPSSLQWDFWEAVATHCEIPVPDIDMGSLRYCEALLSVSAEVRLHDSSIGRLYCIHHGAALICADLRKMLNL